MSLLEKVLYIQKSFNFTDREFCNKFKIKIGILKKWKAATALPNQKQIKNLCDELGLDINDFVSESSTLSKELLKDGEHLCAKTKGTLCKESMILEDFPREDNSRYEEKD